MSLSDKSSSNFLNKSKSTANDAGATQTTYDVIEHDVTDLAKVTNLPSPDSFDALHISYER